jgi:hypothetical protein
LTLVPNSSQMVANNLGVAATSWPLLSSQPIVDTSTLLPSCLRNRLKGSMAVIGWCQPLLLPLAAKLLEVSTQFLSNGDKWIWSSFIQGSVVSSNHVATTFLLEEQKQLGGCHCCCCCC